jgi:hypothetical protein
MRKEMSEKSFVCLPTHKDPKKRFYRSIASSEKKIDRLHTLPFPSSYIIWKIDAKPYSLNPLSPSHIDHITCCWYLDDIFIDFLSFFVKS